MRGIWLLKRAVPGAGDGTGTEANKGKSEGNPAER